MENCFQRFESSLIHTINIFDLGVMIEKIIDKTHHVGQS